MLKKLFLLTGAFAIFILGAYAQDAFRITPVITAVFHTLKLEASDFYVTYLARYLAEVNTVSALAALVGFSALLSLKLLSREGKM